MPEPKGEQLSELEELLFRQVHPQFVDGGRISGQAFRLGSQAFRPTPKDAGMLSVAQESKTSAQDSYKLFTEKLKLPSAGVWAVSVSECEESGLPSFSDPIEEDLEQGIPANPAHAVIDFRELSEGQKRKKSKALAKKATERGCLYNP